MPHGEADHLERFVIESSSGTRVGKWDAPSLPGSKAGIGIVASR